MRLMSFCSTPPTVPTSMVAIAITHSDQYSTWLVAALENSGYSPAVKAKRHRAKKAAALTPLAMKAVTGVGAPWYTSGLQEWKGTAAILNSKPTTIKITPTGTSRPGAPTWAQRVMPLASRL